MAAKGDGQPGLATTATHGGAVGAKLFYGDTVLDHEIKSTNLVGKVNVRRTMKKIIL